MKDKSYRERIYHSYVTAREKSLVPETLDGLKPRIPYLRQMVKRFFPDDNTSKILDIGCGHGALLHVLYQSGYTQAVGVDDSPEQVAAAHRLGIAGVERGGVMSVLSRTADASLDVVVAFDLIEHFTKNELLLLVDEVHRALKPGGRWIIHTPNAEAPFGSRIFWGDFTHELAFTRSSLTQLLMASGFSTVTCYEDRPVPHGLKSLVRAVLWMLVRSVLFLYIAVETGSTDKGSVFSQNLLAVAFREAST